ncbi:DUF4144 family protein [Shewanella sp. 0m-8]
MDIQSLNWPILLKQKQQDELFYLDSIDDYAEQTSMLAELHNAIFIDSDGKSYQLDKSHHTPCLHLCSPQIDFETLIQWTRLHASQAGHCCTSKLSAKDIRSLFEIIAFIEHQ